VLNNHFCDRSAIGCHCQAQHKKSLTSGKRKKWSYCKGAVQKWTAWEWGLELFRTLLPHMMGPQIRRFWGWRLVWFFLRFDAGSLWGKEFNVWRRRAMEDIKGVDVVMPWGALILALLSWEQKKEQKSVETKMIATDLHSRTMCNVLEGCRGVLERDGKKGEKRKQSNIRFARACLALSRCDLRTKLRRLYELHVRVIMASQGEEP
jgi:hypothetical protein